MLCEEIVSCNFAILSSAVRKSVFVLCDKVIDFICSRRVLNSSLYCDSRVLVLNKFFFPSAELDDLDFFLYKNCFEK